MSVASLEKKNIIILFQLNEEKEREIKKEFALFDLNKLKEININITINLVSKLWLFVLFVYIISIY